MEQYLIIARSVTYAQRMQRALGRAGIACRIYRAPGSFPPRAAPTRCRSAPETWRRH